MLRLDFPNKITRNNVFSAWTELSMALIGETITDNNSLSTIVNGRR